MKITKEEFEKLKKRTPEQLKEDIEKLIRDIELIYKTLEEQIEEIGCIVGNEPFESMVSDDELNEIVLPGMNGELETIRERIYEFVREYNLFELLIAIFDGFSVFGDDEYHQKERVRLREIQEQKNILQIAIARCPDYKVTYSLIDPTWNLYQKRIAHFYYKKGKGRYPDTQINNLIKKLYKILSPFLDSKSKIFKFIQLVFKCFYAIDKDEKAIEKAILKKEPTS